MTFDLTLLEAERAITDNIYAYCTAIDTGHLDDMARLFSRGTWYLTADTPISGFEEVSDFLRSNVILYDGVPGTRHTVSNLRIELDESGTSARARSIVIVFQAVPGSEPHIMFQGAYDDTFKLHDDGTWWFDERRIQADGTGDMSLHLRGTDAQAVGA